MRFRVSSSKDRVSGFGLGVGVEDAEAEGLLWVSGFGFRVSGFGFRVSGFGFRVSGFGFRVAGFGFRERKLWLMHPARFGVYGLESHVQRFRGGLVIKAHRL